MWLRHRKAARSGRAEQARAAEQAAASLARAEADHEHERRAVRHDTPLIESLRRIRSENHVKDVIAAALAEQGGGGGMTQARLAADLADDMVMLAFAASVLFVVAWSVVGAWWRSEVGRAFVMFDTALALTLAPSVLHRLTGVSLASTWFAWYFVGSLALVALATLWRTAIVIKTQWRGRERDDTAS